MRCIKGLTECAQCGECSTKFLEKLLKGACKPNNKIPEEVLCSTISYAKPEDRFVAETRTRLYVEPDFSINSLLENLESR